MPVPSASRTLLYMYLVRSLKAFWTFDLTSDHVYAIAQPYWCPNYVDFLASLSLQQ